MPNLAKKFTEFTKKDKDWLSILLTEMRRGPFAVRLCDSIIEVHPEVAIQKNSDGVTALMEAAKRDQPYLCKLLIERGASGAEIDNAGRTPMHYFAMGGAATFMTMCQLLDAGGNINARDASGRAPLHYAVSARNYDAIRNMKAFGADTRIPDNNGETPAELALRLQSPAAVKRELLKPKF